MEMMLTPEELAYSGAYVGLDGRLACHEDIILLEYTGKMDTLGRHIFDHDIVDFDEVIPIDTEMTTAVRRRGMVVWMDSPGWYTIKLLGDDPRQIQASNTAVVGNALATPQLLDREPIPYDVIKKLVAPDRPAHT